MPIYTATNEIVLQDAIESSELEPLTGADILISGFKLPITESLIQKHIDSGAIMIQRKSGMDLIASIGYRLESSLARMTAIKGVCPYQCVLLFSGSLDCNASGMAVVNGRSTDMHYTSVIGAIDAWIMRGGTYINLKSDLHIPDYIYLKEKKVREMMGKPEKDVYPPPLQKLNYINDWRLSIATFPMIGEVRANKIRDFLLENKIGDSLLQAMVVITDPKYSGKDNVGQSVVAACRSWLGLPDGWNLDIKPEE